MDEIRTTGEILLQYLYKNKISQKELAKLIGKSQPHVSNVMQGKKPPTKELLTYFEENYGLTVQDLSDIQSYEEYKKISVDWKRKIFDLMEENRELKGKVESLKELEKFKEAFTVITLENFAQKNKK